MTKEEARLELYKYFQGGELYRGFTLKIRARYNKLYQDANPPGLIWYQAVMDGAIDDILWEQLEINRKLRRQVRV